MSLCHAYAAFESKKPLRSFTFERRLLRPHDVWIDIAYCGVCHSDLHTARNEWRSTLYPLVPGHEILGEVKQVGEKVSRFKPGDKVAVGCLVDSCRACMSCQEGLEQYCEENPVFTYNSLDRQDQTVTQGGYSTHIVVDESFVLSIPKQYSPSDYPRVAPLLCAGITTYSPLVHWKVGVGSTVAVVGIGGLGHVAIKIARALGAYVVAFTSSSHKQAEAVKLGAHEAILSSDAEAMKKQSRRFDFILDTVAASHNLDPFIDALKRDGTLCLVGAPEYPHPSPTIGNLIHSRREIAGSLIGGLRETQEMLDFCAKHHILADIELIPIQKINEAYERMIRGEVKYRFVIDISSLKS